MSEKEKPPNESTERKAFDDDAINRLIATVRTEAPRVSPEILKATNKLDAIGGSSKISREVTVELTTVFGAFSGVKPAGVVYVPALETHSKRLDSGKFADIITRMGMHIEPIAHDTGTGLVAVSRYQELAEALSDSWPYESNESRVDPERERRLGTLLGYPPTSTEYYIKRVQHHEATGEWLPTPSDKYSGEYAQLVLSPDNHEQELREYSVPLGIAINKYAPAIYARNHEISLERSKERKISKIGKKLLGNL